MRFFLFFPSSGGGAKTGLMTFRFIRHALPLEPSFEKKALDSLLKGVAMDTSELFAHFDNGLAKILHMAEAPQLQDVSS